MRRRPGRADLAFLVAFLEGTPVVEARERVSLLATVTRRSYDWLRGVIFAALFVIPFIEGTSLFSVARIFLPADQSVIVAIASAALLIPIDAVLIDPFSRPRWRCSISGSARRTARTLRCERSFRRGYEEPVPLPLTPGSLLGVGIISE